MYAYFERFELQMTQQQAKSASHSGQCDADVTLLCRDQKIIRQLDRIGADKIREELEEYGAWEEDQLKDDAANRHRIVWIAAGNIVEEFHIKARG